ncbi:MAG: DegV family protein [Anaerolineaceae bacterium]|nr:DegV family protein [Anaerolineaceae bacterium]
MANRIALITDSTCDIPTEWIEEFDITVIPLTIVWGTEQFLDGVELSAADFYQRLEADPVIPSTSQPSPQVFLNAYQQASEKVYEEILVIVISDAMSGIIQSARQAADESPIPVHIVNSKSNSMGLGWQVIAAARAQAEGGGLEEMLAAADEVHRNTVYYITLNTMEYLSKGGRIGTATKFLSHVLLIKPLIYINHETGAVAPSIPARSRKNAINGLMKQFLKHINIEKPIHIAVVHNAALDEAKKLAERVIEEFHPEEIIISIVSPILGVHTGPKALALCGYNED